MTQPLCAPDHNRASRLKNDGRTIASDTSVNKVGPQRRKNSHLARDQDRGRELGWVPCIFALQA